MTPNTTPVDAPLPAPAATAESDGLLLAPASFGQLWASLGAEFARFFHSPASPSDAGESVMDSPSL